MTDPWIERADQPCPFCLQRYALELQVRCVACDRPICSVCAVRIRESRETFCTECPPDDAGEEKRDGEGTRNAGGGERSAARGEKR